MKANERNGVWRLNQLAQSAMAIIGVPSAAAMKAGWRKRRWQRLAWPGGWQWRKAHRESNRHGAEISASAGLYQLAA